MGRRLLKKTGYKIIESCIPEISILKKNINWNSYSDYSNSSIPATCKITSPYNIQDSELGDFTYIERNSFISETTIGKFCSIGPNLNCGWGIHPTNGISTSPMFYSTKKQNGVTFSDKDKIRERKRITVGNDVFIGINVTILDGVTIGDGAVIGAGSVVSKNIPPYAIAVGSPIKVIKYRFEEHQIEALLKIRWWDFPEEQLKDIEKMFFDLDTFIQKYEV